MSRSSPADSLPPEASPHVPVRQARRAVLAASLFSLVLKLLIAMNTYGTEDVDTWRRFAFGVRQHGPVGIYGVNYKARTGLLYNHPPLVGDLLAVLNTLSDWRLGFQITLRGLSSLSDVVSALVVFELLRTRTDLTRARRAALGVALSPVLVLVSGYHGNTDPIFLALLLLGTYLVVDKRLPFYGGMVLACSISIKLVPVVALPSLGVYLACRRRRHRDLISAAAGFAITAALIWGPAVLLQWPALQHNVFGYTGIPDRPWGPVSFATKAHLHAVAHFLIGPGRIGALAVCAVAPAVFVWRRPHVVVSAVASSLLLFLVLSPAFSVQYLAWGVAAGYLVDGAWARAFNVLGGLLLLKVYDRWNDGSWGRIAFGKSFTTTELVCAGVLWAVLVVLLITTFRSALLGVDEPPARPRRPRVAWSRSCPKAENRDMSIRPGAAAGTRAES